MSQDTKTLPATIVFHADRTIKWDPYGYSRLYAKGKRIITKVDFPSFGEAITYATNKKLGYPIDDLPELFGWRDWVPSYIIHRIYIPGEGTRETRYDLG